MQHRFHTLDVFTTNRFEGNPLAVFTDGDGLSDFPEIHKYRTDPRKFSTASDGISDGDRQRGVDDGPDEPALFATRLLADAS